MMSSAGIYLPKTIGHWGLGRGYNPADLGEDIKDNAYINDTHTNNIITRDYHTAYLSSPSNQGNCN